MADGPPVDLGIAGLGLAVRIGSGGFADVYRAEQVHLRREVAVKVLRAPASDTQARMRFERECHAVGAVSGHPNIVGVHGGGFTGDGRAYLVMEYCPGGSLLDRLRGAGPLAAVDVVEIGTKIGKALGVAHEAGVLHRDVKPANILVTAFGEPALADFGIARVEGGQQTATGMVTASIAHAAPEVLEGGHPSTASDLYSLGSTLFELCVGRAPHFRPGDESVWALMNRVLSEPVPEPAAVGIPEPLARVIRRATMRSYDHRYPSAADLVADLMASGAPAPLAAPPLAGSQQQPPTVPHPQVIGTASTAGTASIATDSLPIAGQTSTGGPPLAGPLTGGWQPAAGPPPGDPMRRPRRGAALALASLIVVAMAGAGAGLWYYLGPGSGSAPLTLTFPEGASGPLDEGVAYDLAVDGSAGEAATYRLVVDGEPVGESGASPGPYVPEAGRHSVAVEVTRGSSVETTDTLEIYAIGDLPAPSFRANLASVMAEADNWPAAIRAFDRLLDEGHTGLLLLPSERFVSLTSNYWSLFVAGFDDPEQARAYCERHDRAIPTECFTSPFTANT